MKEQYFVIVCGEDGVCIHKIDNIDSYLQESIEEGNEFLSDFPEDRWNKRRDEVDRDNYFDFHERILIKGKIVSPKKVKVVEQYQIGEDE